MKFSLGGRAYIAMHDITSGNYRLDFYSKRLHLIEICAFCCLLDVVDRSQVTVLLFPVLRHAVK